jgi:hypothetical protein
MRISYSDPSGQRSMDGLRYGRKLPGCRTREFGQVRLAAIY